MKKHLRPAIAFALLCLMALTAARPALAETLRAAGEYARRIAFSARAELYEFDGYASEHSFHMTGTIEATAPIRRVEAELYDLRQLETVSAYVWTPEEGEEITSLSLEPIRRGLFGKYRAGEMRMRVTAFGDDGQATVVDRDFYMDGEIAPPRNITSDCEIASVEGRKWIWNDGESWSDWAPDTREDTLGVTLPDGVEAEGMAIVWSLHPGELEIRYFDESGALLGETRAEEADFVPYHAYYAYPEGTRSVRIRVPSHDTCICDLLVFEKGKTSKVVQKWRETADDWDLMLVSTHQDDEHLFFGGTIARYAREGREVGVLYMANCGRDRYGEALDGLWAAGLTNYPVFLGYKDGMMDSLRAAYSRWGGFDSIVETLVARIRAYTPEVVLTHDYRGEYGHYQHIATANAVTKAVELAADPDYMPESCADSEPWQVKKLYIHLYAENPIELDWDEPIPGFGGMNGIEISRMSYAKHRSQQEFVSYGLGVRHSNREFGLKFTTVGLDTRKDDFFENVD